MQKRWEHFPHEADVGVRGIGASKAEAFEQAGLALMHVITDPLQVEDRTAVPIQCAAPDDELLLVDWLNALIYQMATRKMLFRRFSVHIDGQQLDATAFGERTEPARHAPAVEPKGATFTALRVSAEGDGTWVAQCVVDV